MTVCDAGWDSGGNLGLSLSTGVADSRFRRVKTPENAPEEDPVRHRLIVGIAALALLCLGMTGVDASAEPPPNSQYTVEGPSDSRQRSAVAATGAAIDQVDPASIVVTATEAEVAAIKKLGYKVTKIDRSLSPKPAPSTSRRPTPATTTTRR
nr:hypothetical protein GCM10020093_037690 [Planobispora longispora]